MKCAKETETFICNNDMSEKNSPNLMPSITGVVRIEKNAVKSQREKYKVVLSLVLNQLKKEKIQRAKTAPTNIPSM